MNSLKDEVLDKKISLYVILIQNIKIEENDSFPERGKKNTGFFSEVIILINKTST